MARHLRYTLSVIRPRFHIALGELQMEKLGERPSAWTHSTLVCVALAVLAGVLVTVQDYEYGSGNHVEQLNIILRTLDTRWLSNDFFVNASASFGVRTYYASFLALCSKLLPLPTVFLLLTFLSNTLVFVITGLAAKDLFGDTASFLAIPLVAAGNHVSVGDASFLVSGTLIPQLLAMPLMLVSVWAAVRQKALLCSSCAAVGAFIHPLLAMETGLIGLSVIPATQLLFPTVQGVGKSYRTATSLVLAFVILGLSSAQWLIHASSSSIDASQFIDIVAHFRHPHHYLPSSFRMRDYADSAFFMLAVLASWFWLVFGGGRSFSGIMLSTGLIIALISLLCIGGYLFVEIMPSRLWTTAQVFRLLYLVNWLGAMIIAASLATFLTSEESDERFGPCLLLSGALSAFMLGVLHTVWFLGRKILQPKYINMILLGILVGYYAREALPNWHIALLLAFSLILSGARSSASPPERFVVPIISLSVMFLLAGFLFPSSVFGWAMSKFADRPVITLSDTSNPIVPIADYALAHSPNDAVFLTPPDWGQFRLLAARAIVVDFKAFPFDDHAMVEWRRRLFDCYGRPESAGFAALAEMTTNYADISDSALRRLQMKYDVTYAVLFRDTRSSFQEVYATDVFKIVYLGELKIQ